MPAEVAQAAGRPVQTPVLAAGALAAATLYAYLIQIHPPQATPFLIGLGMGVALYHGAFGFTGAYRRAIVDKDMSGIAAQAIMLALAMALFAPVLAEGRAFGHAVGGAVAPVGVSMVFGAFLFGIGMQFGGGCASGTLFSVGGGSVRMVVVLIFFCAGCFLATFHMGWWWSLPDMGAVSLGKTLGWPAAIGLQLAVLAAVLWGLRRAGFRAQTPLWPTGWSWRRLASGPWPLFGVAVALALLNFATLLSAGHPWSITWGFTLWAAKAAQLLGWDPAGVTFWRGGFQVRALAGPVLADTTTVMNVGIILGALAAAALAGRLAPSFRIPPGSLAAAMLGGLIMGYGARLAYGCNIGAFFSGVASNSLHGWAWIVAAGVGNVIGVKLRPLFGLANR